MTTQPQDQAKKAPKIVPLQPGAADALEARGVMPELAAQYGVQSVDRPHGDWVAFRHHVDGGALDHWAYRSLTGEKRFFQSAGTKRVFWNNQVITDPAMAGEPLIITEGHIDALTFLGTGFRRVVSVPDGAPDPKTANAPNKYDFLVAAGLDEVREIILAVDNDTPGLLLQNDLAVRLGRKRCRSVKWPDGCKDANDVANQVGQDTLRDTIRQAKWCKLVGFYTLDELPDEPEESPVRVGIAGLDDLWRVSQGRQTILTGMPGSGKTELLCDVVCHLAMNHGWVSALGSFEDKPKAMLVPRLVRWFIGRDPRGASAKALADAYDFIRAHFVFIQNDDDEDEPATVDWFLDTAEAAVLRHNVKLVVGDPWNEMDHTHRPEGVSVTEYVNVKLGKCRRHARRLNYHQILAPHPVKMKKDKDGKYPIATGYDISDSAAWVNKPDSGLTVYRHEDDTVTLASWKAKSAGKIGYRGERSFRFDVDSGKYHHAPELEDREPSDYQKKAKAGANSFRSPVVDIATPPHYEAPLHHRDDFDPETGEVVPW